MTFIYALVDPNTNIVKYVGKSDKPNKRYGYHLSCFGANYHKNNWISSLKKNNQKPILKILEEVGDDWQEREREYIKEYSKFGELTNIAEGGEGISSKDANSPYRNLIRKFINILQTIPTNTERRRSFEEMIAEFKNGRKRFLEIGASDEYDAWLIDRFKHDSTVTKVLLTAKAI